MSYSIQDLAKAISNTLEYDLNNISFSQDSSNLSKFNRLHEMAIVIKFISEENDKDSNILREMFKYLSMNGKYPEESYLN